MKHKSKNGSKKKVVKNAKNIVNNITLEQLLDTQTNKDQITTKKLHVDVLKEKLQSLPKNAPIVLGKEYSIVVVIIDDTKLQWAGHVDLSKIPDLMVPIKNVWAVMFTAWLDALMQELAKVAHYSESPSVEFTSEDEMNYSVVIECDSIASAQDIMHNTNIMHLDTFRKTWVHNVDRYGMGSLLSP